METLRYNTLIINEDCKLCVIDGERILLSKKEYELLAFLLSKPDYVHSRESIIENVWKRPISLRAVDATVSRLRKKLKQYSNNLETRLGFGYSFRTKDG